MRTTSTTYWIIAAVTMLWVAAFRLMHFSYFNGFLIVYTVCMHLYFLEVCFDLARSEEL